MSVELFKKDLSELIKSVHGLLAVLILDRDGVPIIEVHKDHVPELALQASALSMAVMSADQVTKLGFGKCNTVCSEYDNYKIVTFNKLPTSLLVTMIGNSSANMGVLLALRPDFDQIIKELTVVLR